MAVVIETTMGSVTVDLYIKERPITCTNFLKLCKMKYYNFSLFHCVQNNFIAQTGDPTGTGNGGESVFGMIHGEKAKYYEAEVIPKIKHSRAGLVSMVNCGNNMLGSQFFFTLGEDLHSLDSEHCVFGEVAEGLEVLIQLNEVICDEKHHPFRDIRITHTVILEDPFDDPPNLVFPDHSPDPTKERLMNGRIAPDEEVDDTKGKSLEEVEEMVQKREAQARATILEIVGDIPDAEIAPPENILFVCKLNPVTTDEDLEIIFGRFGVIKSCEVIRDKTTGDSLQYAFIEFDDKKACENAYFKMDNVLIDDRRIHVDFSQSVAKMRWRGKGKGVDYFPDAKQKDSQTRISKDGEPPKFEQRERKRRRSRSRSPHKWKNQEERISESWEKYHDRKDKYRETSARNYKKSRDSSDGRIRNYEDKSKGADPRGQRNTERNKDTRDWSNDHNYKWESRMRFDGKDHHHHGRCYASERMEMENLKIRERRNRNVERSDRRDGDTDEKYRTSKERSSKGEKRSEDLERLRNDRAHKDDLENKNVYGETSRYDARKVDSKDLSKKKKQDRNHKVELEPYKYVPDVSSENEERSTSRNKKKRLEEDKERGTSNENNRKISQLNRNDESQFLHYGKNTSDDQTSSRILGREDSNKDRTVEQRNSVDANDTDGSPKFEMHQPVKTGSKYNQDSNKGKKGSEKKISKRNSSDGLRQSWPSEKMKKEAENRGRKIVQKRKRYSSSSSCCSNSSCSCSCCSSSSDSDLESNSEFSESFSSSSTSPERKVSAKKKRNRKKVQSEIKKNRTRRSGHKKRQRMSSESSGKSLDEDYKGKRKHRKRKVDDSSSSEQKIQSRGKKVKKRRKKSQKRKSDSSESSSEASSSSSSTSNSYAQRKMCGAKRKKLKKGVTVKKKVRAKRSKSIKHRGKKLNSVMTSKKKRKRNYVYQSESSDSSAESDSGSSREEHKHRKEQPVKGKGVDQIRSR